LLPLLDVILLLEQLTTLISAKSNPVSKAETDMSEDSRIKEISKKDFASELMLKVLMENLYGSYALIVWLKKMTGWNGYIN